MHLSYYYLHFISEELALKLRGATLAECYLQSRHEFVAAFYKDSEEFFIKLNFFPDFTCIAFPETFQRSKKSTYNYFKEAYGSKVLEVVQHQNDRSFHLTLENNYSLLFKLHGSRANVLCYHTNVCIDLINKSLPNDRQIDLSEVHQQPEQTFEAFLKQDKNLRSLFPAFDKTVLRYLTQNGYETLGDTAQWQLLEATLKKLQTPRFLLCQQDTKVVLSFFETDTILQSFTSAIEAANAFERLYGQDFYFKREQQTILTSLAQKHKKATGYLDVINKKLQELKTQTRYDEIGHILMASLHEIPLHKEEVTLTSFYTGNPIRIKLKPNLSPQKNAENYFRKAKNQKLEFDELEKNILQKEETLTQIAQHLEAIRQISELRPLRKYLKEHLLQTPKNTPEKEAESLFRNFTIDGFEILVGKNAHNNDLLTQKHSFKEDLWLHARGVTGSHVLIKYQAGKKFPKSVIEKAAQIAAYYSKMKTNSLCPVIVTPKKYVRKPKGAEAGQVVIEREEVVLVPPALPF
jgi:predicted ribosome quality control (RQC) complex YloA/Tae2 family protein